MTKALTHNLWVVVLFEETTRWPQIHYHEVYTSREEAEEEWKALEENCPRSKWQLATLEEYLSLYSSWAYHMATNKPRPLRERWAEVPSYSASRLLKDVEVGKAFVIAADIAFLADLAESGAQEADKAKRMLDLLAAHSVTYWEWVQRASPWKLYLDDVRPIPEGWVGARTVAEFISLIESRGLPDALSLDHDLGGEETAMEAVHWMIDRELDTREVTITVHSANPVGADNLRGLLASWHRHLSEQHG